MLLLLCTLLSAGCTNHIPRSNLPLITNERCEEQVKVVTIPLPVIASSPNEGITAGALTAFLVHNKEDEVHALFAPQINYNKNFGISSSLYGAVYPTKDLNIEFNLAHSTKVNFNYETRIKQTGLLDNKLDINAFVGTIADGSARFFGFDARTPVQNETNYNDQEIFYNLAGSYSLGKHFKLEIGHRFRDVEIRKGAVTKVPYIKDVFTEAEVPGINGFTTNAPRISLIYSTLDDKAFPTFGGYTRITFEPTISDLGGAGDYRHYEVEAKGFIPFADARYVSVFRFMYNQTLGDNVPFLEQSILGGENSLRGYGRNRFVDNCFFLVNLEERIRLFRWEIFNVNADWELAPFVDIGTVMDRVDRIRINNFEVNPGIGFRATVKPNIVGRVDIGIGREGPAVFVGLGYPF